MTATDESMMKQNCLLLNKCYETTASSFVSKTLAPLLIFSDLVSSDLTEQLGIGANVMV